MRALLEKAIVHLLNEDQKQFEKLIHEFMVQRGRQIHEKLRQGEDVSLTEGWDDEITTESYFGEADLDDAEDDAMDADMAADDADMAADDADMAADDAADDLESDMGDDAGMGDDDMADDEDMGDGDVDDRLDDIEAQIEKLSAEFEKIMADDSDDDMADDEMGDETADDTADGDMDAMAGDDDMGDEDDMEDDSMDGVRPKMEGKMPDAFKKNIEKMKAKKADKKDVKEAEKPEEDDDDADDEDEDEDFEDITESVLADLEKVVIDLSNKDGVESDGKKVANHSVTSPIPQKPSASRTPGKPVVVRGDRHTGFEKEAAPSVASMKPRKNTHASAKSVPSPVAKPGNSEPVVGPTTNKTPKVNATKKSPVVPRKGGVKV